MDDVVNFFEDIIDKLRIISFQIPEQVFQGIMYLTKFVGYFLPLRLYLPIITLFFGMIFIKTVIKVITKALEIGRSVFSVIMSVKGSKIGK